MSRVHFAQKDVLILTRYLNLQISLFCLSKKPKETNAKIVFIYVRGSWAAGHFGQIHYQAIDVFFSLLFFSRTADTIRHMAREGRSCRRNSDFFGDYIG